MLLADKWQDYKIIDCGEGEKLENIGGFIVSRPDSQVIWSKRLNKWTNMDAIYHRSDKGGGYWQYINKPKDNFIIKYGDLSFKIEFTNFKHIGLFPEQAVNWQFIIDKIKEKKSSAHENMEIKALNLFAYTGGATAACAYAGCDEVVHVDASKKIVSHAKTNIEINNLHQKKVRFIIEDVIKFVLREVRRKRKYDVIIMDPPVYGRGPNGELWQIETSLTRLVEECIKLLSDSPILFLINCYTASFSHISLKNILSSSIKNKGTFESGEIGLPIENSDMILPCGIYARFYT
ncbi:class I SAM-dependent methyltransferase [uncultured Brachyspira sp.]|uniref:class I SAM-dependent methyltransferase n=1 Tax=uncultured Brachyspira sp. TaxID=221953 RepID=UPI002631EFB4|nr:class I SAM-dependent methyltransferase [uncultured Brachyspira sp.]